MSRPSWTKRTEHRKLTGRPWRRLRDQVMERDKWLCQPCKRKGKVTEATECDHIVALANGGTDDIAGLQAICGPCHVAKTLKDSGIIVKPEISVDGWPIA